MGVVSRTGVGLAILLTGLMLFYAAFVFAPAFAQDNANNMVSGDQNNSNGDCENAQEVTAFEGSAGEDLTSETFQIEGSRFRVSFEDDGTGSASALVTVNDEDEDFEADFVDSFIAGSAEEQNSLILNAGPGNFFIEVEADGDAGYTVTVEDCGGNGGNNDDGGNNDGDDANNDGVIDDTVPNKDLPDTGGLPIIVVSGTAVFLLFGILVSWRLKTREG